MKNFLLRLLTVIGGLVVVALLVAVAIGVGVQVARSRVPGKTLLEANLETGLLEYVPDDPVAQVMLSDKPVLRDTAEALQKAAGDRKVVGLVATLAPLAWAWSRSRRSGTRCSLSVPPRSRRWPSPRPSARWRRATAPTTWPAPSTRSTSSPPATLASLASSRRAPSCGGRSTSWA